MANATEDTMVRYPRIELFTEGGWWWADLTKATAAEEFALLGVDEGFLEKAPLPFGSRVPAGRVIELVQHLNPSHVVSVRSLADTDNPIMPRDRCTVCGATGVLGRCLRNAGHPVETLH